MDFVALNEKVAEMNAKSLVDTGRHISMDVGRDTWENTSKGGG